MKSRTFTREEAAKTLPLIRRIAGDIVRTYRELSRHADRYRELRTAEPRGPEVERELADRKARMAALSAEIDVFVGEIDEVGCEVKDLETGTVDFLSRLDGRRVYLCWRLGEERVEHWHEVTEGFKNRRPLPVTVTEP